MTILAIDTSTKFSSVSLQLKDGTIICNETTSENSHDEELTALVSKTLDDAGVKFSQLSSLIAGSGPGSFTGLRIGFSFLKGLAASLEIPLYVQPTFNAIASVFGEGKLLVLVDARRSEWFSALFNITPDGRVVEIEPVEIRSSEQIVSLLNTHGSAVISTPNMELFKELCSDSARKCELTEPNKISKGLILLNNQGCTPLNPQMDQLQFELAQASPSYMRAVAAKTIAEREGIKKSKQ